MTRKVSELLTAARTYLWDGTGPTPISYHPMNLGSPSPGCEVYVCHAIQAVGYETVDPPQSVLDGVQEACDRVLGQLDGNLSFDGYLAGQLVPAQYLDDPEWMQLRRRELLTMLISHFERREGGVVTGARQRQ